jgi:hypothetical protein
LDMSAPLTVTRRVRAPGPEVPSVTVDAADEVWIIRC